MKRDLIVIGAGLALTIAALVLWLGLIAPGLSGDERPYLPLEGSIWILIASALAGLLATGLARRPLASGALVCAGAFALMIVAVLLNAVLAGKSYEAAGPSAMALLFPVLLTMAGVPAALLLRAAVMAIAEIARRR